VSLEVIFAYVVGVLAGLAVIGALAFALVWEWCAIRRTLAARDDPPPPLWRREAWWRERGAAAPTVPQRRKWR
jgi:hypothetical protein